MNNLINKLFNRLKKNKLLKSLSVLASGTGIAQIILIASSPILTRFYPPEDFGIYAVYISIYTILSGIVMLDFNNIITVSDKSEEAKKGILLSSIVLIVFCSFLLFVSIILKYQKQTIWNSSINDYFILIPFALLINGINVQLYNYFLRYGYLKIVATNKIIISVLTASIQIIFGFFYIGSWGLVIAHFFSLTLASIVFIIRFRNVVRIPKSYFNLKQLFKLAKKYKRFPLVSVWGRLINIFALQVPELFISSFFGLDFLGKYSLANKTISKPMSILSTSIQEVFRKAGAQEFSENKTLKKTYKSILIMGLVIGAIALPFFYFMAPPLFQLIFGSEWTESGEIVKTMSFLFVIRFIASPLSYSYYILNKQSIDFFWQIGLLILTVSVLLGSTYFKFDSPIQNLELYVLVISIWYIVNLTMTSRISNFNFNFFNSQRKRD